MSCVNAVFYIHFAIEVNTMKVVLLCLVLALSGLDAQFSQLSGVQKEKAEKYVIECMKQSGVKPELIADAKKGQFSNTDEYKKFNLCFFQKAGIVGSDGKLNVQAALAKQPPGVDKTHAAKVLDDCKNKKGKTPEDTAFKTFKCYYSGIKAH